MRNITIVSLVLGLSLVAGRSVLAESENESEHGNGNGGDAAVVRPQHDVVCTLRVASKKGVPIAGSTVTATIRVANRARRTVHDVALALYADSTSGTPLWSQTTWIRGHRTLVRKVKVEVPAGATSLIAVATSETDDNPGNNMDTITFGVAPGGTTGGGSTGGGTTTHSPSAVAGAATYASNCASCHGADAKGTSRGPRILRRSAGDVYEAMREGEDGMPRFPALTSMDAKNLAAFLADPSAATSPPPTTPQPPAGQAPTYAAQIQPLLASSCVVCHQGTSAPKGVRLDTYATASANASASLAAIQAGRMPPGGVPLPSASIQLFADWVAGGAK